MIKTDNCGSKMEVHLIKVDDILVLRESQEIKKPSKLNVLWVSSGG